MTPKQIILCEVVQMVQLTRHLLLRASSLQFHVKMKLTAFISCVAAAPAPFEENAIVPVIIGGEKADIGEFPWQISQRRGTMGSPGSHMCGGSIGSEKYIITAAHCKYNTSLIVIAYG